MIDKYKCIVCKQGARGQRDSRRLSVVHVECDRCGRFEALEQDDEVSGYLIPAETRHLLSAFLRRHFDQTGMPFTIDHRDGRAFPSGFVEPSVTEKIARTLALAANRSKSFGARVSVTPHDDWSRIGARDGGELEHLLAHLVETHMLVSDSLSPASGAVQDITVTGKGWAEVDLLRPSRTTGRQAFVAMSFHDDLAPAFETGIEPALNQDSGYEALRVDRSHPEGKIDDFILAELRRSRLLVADLTKLRPSVILEAGFALGLEIPVIWTCRRDNFDAVQRDLFDARQYAFLLWDAPGDLRALLRDRIRARFPLRA